MTGRQRLQTVFSGGIPDRVPVSLPGIDPCQTDSFYHQHPSFSRLLEQCRLLQDTIRFYRPDTGFFFTLRESVALSVHENRDTPISTETTVSAQTAAGILSRTVRRTTASCLDWVVKPWVETHRDIEKFLSLPWVPYLPDFSGLAAMKREVAERGIVMVRLSTPLGVTGSLFAPGQMHRYLFDDPRLFRRLVEMFAERILFFCRQAAAALTGTVVRLRGAEYVSPPALPLDTWRTAPSLISEYVLRYDRPIIEALRSAGSLTICYHWHDFSPELAPLILKLQPDIVEPVCVGMQRRGVVADARRLMPDTVIMGGIETEDMQFRSPQEVRALAHEVIRQAARTGRFVLIPRHVPVSAPLDPDEETNCIELLRCAHEDGVYPIR